MQEAWYIFPVPIFEWIDRNFNVWWVEQHRDLDRINLGIDFTHINLAGRRDRLNFQAKYGYVRQYGLKYAFPYLNKAKTLGLDGQVSYQKKEKLTFSPKAINNFFMKTGINSFIKNSRQGSELLIAQATRSPMNGDCPTTGNQ